MNISTRKIGPHHIIEWTWFHTGLRTHLIILFTLCLDTLVVYGAYKLIVAQQYSSLIILILFPFLAMVMTYYQIAIFLNKTTLEVQEKVLRISAGPLPFYSPREYLRSEIQGVVAEEMAGKKTGKFNVKLVLVSGKKKIVLTVPDENEARLAESELKTALKL